jgi:DNA-binding NtrC family response regulator
MPDNVLVVDDEPLTRETLKELLRDEGFDAESFASPYEALQVLEREDVAVVLTDLRMPLIDGLEFQREIRQRRPDTAVIFMTAFGTVATAVEAMREGAADYLSKPLDSEELIIRLRRVIERQREVEEIRRLRIDAARHGKFGDLVYRSQVMQQVVERALAVADTDATVLVQGETGTGKEVLCRAIHAHSLRSAGPFLAVNCAGLNPNLVESELFGHESGAFTGASRMRKGRLESASGGTLLIDEVDELSPEVQIRLLRFLQDRSFERVGSSGSIRADVRVLCATKRNLKEMVEQGLFREDLYFRVNTVLIALPPLRVRKEDIGPLAERFLNEKCKESPSGDMPVLSPEVLRAFLAYDWPGNVRELEHSVEHAVAFARCGTLEIRHLPSQFSVPESSPLIQWYLDSQDRVSLPDILRDCERHLVEWALARSEGNQVRAAELLAIPRTTLRSRVAALKGNDAASGGSGPADYNSSS